MTPTPDKNPYRPRMGIARSGLLVLLLMLMSSSPLLAQADADGSADLDLTTTLTLPSSTLIGADFSIDINIANESTSEGAAYDVGFLMYLPSGVGFVSSSLGSPYVQTTDGGSGVTTIAIETTDAIIQSDSMSGTVTLSLDPSLLAGTMVTIEAVGYADDSPYERGAAPASQPSAFFGAVDISYPSSVTSQGAAADDDNEGVDYPTSPYTTAAAHLSSATTTLSLFELEVIPQVAEGERATGTGVNAYSTIIRLRGNGVAQVDDVSLEDVLANNREFLGFTTVPSGATAIAVPNAPGAGQVRLDISGVDLPANTDVDIIYSSGIVEYDVTDATNTFTTPSDGDAAIQAGSLVTDGGSSPGGGEAATDDATITAATYDSASVASGLFPPDVMETVEAEYIAIQKGVDSAIKVIGDTATYTITFQVSEYLDIDDPTTITDSLPDGLTFDGSGSVTSSASAGDAFTFDVTSGTPDADGDTEIRFVLPTSGSLPAGASGTITFTATVDNTFEGPGEVDYENGETLTNTVVVLGEVADEGSTDPGIVGDGSGDDSAASIRPPDPSLSKVIVSVTTSGGTLYDGTGGTPTFNLSTDAVDPGSTVRFAITVDFPNVPFLQFILDDYLPLLSGPNNAVSNITFNTDASLVDIDGNLIAVNDSDGDGGSDSSFNGNTPPFTPGPSGFPETIVNNGMRFDMGNVSPDATLVILMDVLITDDVPQPIPTDGLVTTRNNAICYWENDQGGIEDTLNQNVDFRIALPYLSIDKSITAVGPFDAGDTIPYEITVTNGGKSTAFLPYVEDVIDADLTIDTGSITIVDGAGNDISATTAFTQNGQTMRFFFSTVTGTWPNSILPDDGSLPAGENEVVISYNATVAASIAPGTEIANTATADYYSAADADAEDNFGPITDDATTDLDEVSLSKSVFSSDGAHTSGSTMAIGEEVTFRLTARVPEASMTGVQIVDVLPEGLELISAALVSVEAPMTTNGGSNTPTITLSNNLYSDGVDDTATFDFGTISNAGVSGQNDRDIIVEVVARVRDLVSSTDGTRLTNVGQFSDSTGLLDSATRRVTVRRPELDITVTADVAIADANDPVVYTIRVEHAGSSTVDAFNVLVQNILPSEVTFVSLGSISDSGGLSGTPTLSGNGSSGTPIELSVPDLPLGEWVEFTVNVLVNQNVNVATTISNTATGTAETMPTGSTATAPAVVNNGSDGFDTPNVTVGKALSATNSSLTSGTEAAIGEILTFTITVGVPETDAANFQVVDTLPTGMLFVDETSVTVDADITVQTMATADSSTPGSVVWDFDDIVNGDTDNQTDEEIVIVYRAVVANIAANQHNGVLANSAQVTFTGGSSPTGAATVTVKEADLCVTSSILERDGRAGNSIHITYQVWHTGDSAHDASEVMVLTNLTNELIYQSVAVTNGPPPAVDTGIIPGFAVIALGDLATSFNTGNRVEFTVEYELDSDFDGSLLSIDNEVQWTSLDGDPGLAVSGDNSSGERSGSSSNPGGAANDLMCSVSNRFDNFSCFLVGFEDLAFVANSNDFDYNDFLFKVTTVETYNASRELTFLCADFEALSRGAAFHHQLDVRIGVEGSASIYVLRRLADGTPDFPQNLTSNGDYIDDIWIYAQSHDALPSNGTGNFWWSSNTDPSVTTPEPGRLTCIEVTVNEPAKNPEIVDNPATLLINEHIQSLFGFKLFIHTTGNTVLANGVDRNATQSLVDPNKHPGSPLLGYPLDQVRIFARDAKWPTEKSSIWSAFPDFVDFTTSSGALDIDWDLNPASALTWPVGGSPVQPGINISSQSPGTGPAVMSEFNGDSVMPATPAIADIDGDGDQEAVYASFLGTLYVVDATTGTVLQTLDPGQGTMLISQASPTLFDVDGDGSLEVLRGHEDGSMRWMELDGSGSPQTIVTAAGPIKSSVAVGDITGDGSDEIVFLSGDMMLYAWNPQGMVSGFPVSIGVQQDVGGHFFLTPSPALGDLDGDGDLEIVIGNLDSEMRAYQGDGSLVAGNWPFSTQAMVLSSAAIADHDLDGLGEIVATDNDGYVYVLDRQGNLLPNWPVQLPLGGGPSSPSVVDLDANGVKEIIIASQNGAVYSYKWTGTMNLGWPFQTGGSIIASPAIGDVDTDKDLEVVIASTDGKVYLINKDGSQALGLSQESNAYPFATGSMVISSPTLADVDGDGYAEILIGSHDRKGYVLRTEGWADYAPRWSSFRGGAAMSGSFER